MRGALLESRPIVCRHGTQQAEEPMEEDFERLVLSTTHTHDLIKGYIFKGFNRKKLTKPGSVGTRFGPCKKKSLSWASKTICSCLPLMSGCPSSTQPSESLRFGSDIFQLAVFFLTNHVHVLKLCVSCQCHYRKHQISDLCQTPL